MILTQGIVGGCGVTQLEQTLFWRSYLQQVPASYFLPPAHLCTAGNLASLRFMPSVRASEGKHGKSINSQVSLGLNMVVCGACAGRGGRHGVLPGVLLPPVRRQGAQEQPHPLPVSLHSTCLLFTHVLRKVD